MKITYIPLILLVAITSIMAIDHSDRVTIDPKTYTVYVGDTITNTVYAQDGEDDALVFIFKGLDFTMVGLDKCGDVTTNMMLTCSWHITYKFTIDDVGPRQLVINAKDQRGNISNTLIKEFSVRIDTAPKLLSLKDSTGDGDGSGDTGTNGE